MPRSEAELSEPVSGQLLMVPFECESACNHRMLTRCQRCRREQWALAVWSVSHGTEPCVWCASFNDPVLLELDA